MEAAKPPNSLVLEGNLSENFRKFNQNFQIYLKASGLKKLHENEPDMLVAILLNVIGEEAVELFNTFDLTDEQRNDFGVVIKSFEAYVNPTQNVVMERFNFGTRVQMEGESVDNFVTDLKKLSKTCDMGEQTESFIRDRIVIGIRDKGIQESLLRIKDLSLQEAIDRCRTAETSRAQAEMLQGKKKDLFGVVVKEKINDRRVGKVSEKTTSNSERLSSGKTQRLPYRCKKCNRSHEYGKCPAYGKRCLKCGEQNHFAVVCRVKQVRQIKGDIGQLYENSESDNEFEICVVKVYKTPQLEKPSEWTQVLQIGVNKFSFKLDTGAEVSVVTMKIVKELDMVKQIRQSKVLLEAYGGTKVRAVGIITLRCSIPTRNIEKLIEFVVVEEGEKPLKPLLGLNECIDLTLIKRVEILANGKTKENFIKEHECQFIGQGTFKTKCKIKIKPDVDPVVKPPRRIPQTIKKKLKKTLEDLEERGIIVKEEQPEGWVSNLVIVEKADGSLRCCLDPQDLNKVIIKDHFLIPTLEDISPVLCNKMVYTVLDLKDGFWHVELDEESSRLCTFSTPYGCYRFTRLPFGLTTAPEVFQRLNQDNFGDIDGVVIYFDDILIAGRTLEEHDRILEKVMTRAAELNIKFNVKKLQYRVPEVKYLGQVFTGEGVKPDPDRIKAIQNLKSPNNRKELQQLMGIINYLRKYIPNMAALTSSFRELLRKDTEWLWLPTHERALEKVKKKISMAPLIKNYDKNLPLSIQADSSKDGLGCCLLQEGRPIAFASRSLNSAEVNYAQVEKELLAITYAAKKFHHFIYGRQIDVMTDHKPLVSVMMKEIHKIASVRLQRMRLKLLIYNLKVQYLPGRLMFVADLLSRNFVEEPQKEDPEMAQMVHSISKNLHITEAKQKEFQQKTTEDPTLLKLMEYSQKGWPRKNSKIPEEVRVFRKMQNDITIKNGLVFVGEKVVVPKDLRHQMLQLLHKSHFGIEKTKKKARQVMYWPGISVDIANTVKTCTVCGRYGRNNSKEPIIRHELPQLPFEVVGMDICEWGKRSYLVVACYLTRWMEIKKLRDKTAGGVIHQLKDIFATHGIPSKIVADNMPFGSFQFKQFADEWDFQIVTSSPRYPRSNGMAERMVGITKEILKKADEGGYDYRLTLLEYRNTPLTGLMVSPAQLLMSRRLRTKMPINKSLMEPSVQKDYRETMEAMRKKQSEHYNRTAKFRPELNPGEDLWYKKEGVWEPAQLLKTHSTPRSYIIRNGSGHELRRNKIHLKKSGVRFNRVMNTEWEDNRYQTKRVKENDDKEKRNGNKNQYVTRSGRPINQPRRFKDYVMDEVVSR